MALLYIETPAPAPQGKPELTTTPSEKDMHRTTTLVALAACGLFTAFANAQVAFEFTDSGQALGNSARISVALGDRGGDG